ncbi:hypothetical protein THAOC_12877 [Thalassiosira oceanica]|uniref:B30.2/SPRY domain-containing protein n=1 Tax=Thalassiosira oceanica TaxID=159749 RepID=K0T743_THAOC|nr:hypothetical protein THAOC_12877 [Thalassiosira oceanica]|eukprot:EJK66217.1 hypothetical protein THAOC_12877 [Thalassiosira oceanica]
MVCARGAAKRRRISTVEPALTILANIDVLGHLATFLEAGELCQVRATCKTLGSSDESTFDGLSMTEEAARRMFESASDEEKAKMRCFDDEGWIELCHHLLMLRTPLTFDQLGHVEYQAGDKAAVQGRGFGAAICGNHIMRAGKHWATFISGGLGSFVGVIRPLPGWGVDARIHLPFIPGDHEDLRRERTSRWEGDVHFCILVLHNGKCRYSNFDRNPEISMKWSNWEGDNKYNSGINILGTLLDLDNGTLSVYQNGQRLGILKDGLAGQYCWITCFVKNSASIKIERGYVAIDA